MRGVILLLSVVHSNAIKLVREELSQYGLAKCNDGSPAVYYHQQEADYSNEDVMIFLPDGGHCSNIDDCRQRCNLDPKACGTSTIEQEVDRDYGIWSNNGDINPFYNHHKIEIHYCSSDNYAGTRSASENTGNMFFHGKHVITAALEDLTTQHGLAKARSITLVGTGSGARGVGYNCDYVSSLLPTVDVKCLADSPDMVPWWLTSDLCQDRFGREEETEKVFWGREEDESCIRENKLVVNSSDLAQKCGVWSRYWDYVQTPLFIVASQFDTNSLPDPSCLPPAESEDYTEFEVAWRRGMAALFESMLATDSSKSWFVPDCSTHGYLSMNGDTQTQFSRLTINNLDDNKTMSLTESLTEWINTTKPIHSIDEVVSGNLECRESAPLCHSSISCSSGRRAWTDYPSVRSKWLAPTSIYPTGYSRGWNVDPWYTTRTGYNTGSKVLVSGVGHRRGVIGTTAVHSHSADKRRRLWKRLQTLQYLKNLYNRHKTEYTREYYSHGYEDTLEHPLVVTTGSREIGTRVIGHPEVVGTRPIVGVGLPDLGCCGSGSGVVGTRVLGTGAIGHGTRVLNTGGVVGTRVLGNGVGTRILGSGGIGNRVLGSGGIGNRVLGSGGIGSRGIGVGHGNRVAATSPDYEVVSDYDYDYVYYEDYDDSLSNNRGLISRIRNAIRLEKAKDTKEDAKTKNTNDFDDYEDFGPLIEKIIDNMTSRRRRSRKNKQRQLE